MSLHNGESSISSRYPLNRSREVLPSILSTFERDGFVCLSGVFDTPLIQELCASANFNFESCFQKLHKNGHIACPLYLKTECSGNKVLENSLDLSRQIVPEYRNQIASVKNSSCETVAPQKSSKEYSLKPGVKNGFRDIVMRSPGRFEMPYLCESFPFNQPQVLQNERLLNVVRDLLGSNELNIKNREHESDIYLSNISLVISTSGAAEQKWHVDGGHIDLQKHQSCHCLNVFIPLLDMTDKLGPTEFRPGSHYYSRNLIPMMLAAKAKKKIRNTVAPLLKAGDAIIFDYRVLHRGRANLDDQMRPILVLTYAKKWFKDILNFPKRNI